MKKSRGYDYSSEALSGRPSTLPMGKIARLIREDGWSLGALGKQFGVAASTLRHRLSQAGYQSNGRPIIPDRRDTHLADSNTGNLNYVGGGNWDRGLPTAKNPVVYRAGPKPTGLDWGKPDEEWAS